MGVRNEKIVKSSSNWLRYGIAVAGLHILGLSILFVNTKQYPQLLGFGFLAYTFGLRHAFDADHIAAIDNTVRKIIQQRENPMGIGFFFSLGHSTVVFIMALLTAFSMGWAEKNMPQLKEVGSFIGTSVSGVFLVLIGLFNLYIWLDVYKAFSKLRKGNNSENFEKFLTNDGVLSRFMGPLYNLINKSWHVYSLGFLFGLGFDTASEVALLAISANAVTQSVPVTLILCLPILFAAGMSLMDTADGIFMSMAYNWAFATPLKKIYYNLSVTALSVVAALFIGFLELTQILSEKLGLNSGLWQWVQRLDFGNIGYILVVLFVLTWGLSLVFWKVLGLKNN